MKFNLYSQTFFTVFSKLLFVFLFLKCAVIVNGQSPPTGFTHTGTPGTIIGTSPANLSASGSITLEAWIKLPTTVNQTPWTNIIHLGYADNERTVAIWYNQFGFLHCRMGSVMDWNAGCDVYSIPINTWFFFQMVGTATNRSVYINGVLAASVPSAPILTPSTGTPLYASDPWWPGGAILSEVRLWNIARSNIQGLSSMNCQMPPQANLVMYYGGPVITPSVSIAVTGGANPTCSGTGVTFTASATNPGSSPAYQWKKDGINVGTGTTYTDAGNTGGNITCTLTGGITCSTPVTVSSSGINLTINTPIAPVVSSQVNYCLGASAVALSATGTGLKWYSTALGGIGSTTAPTPSTANVGTVNYFVSQSISGCEGSREQISVVVNALPVVSFTGLAVTNCTNDATVTLTGTPTGGTFSGPGISGNTFDPALAGSGTHNITYSYIDVNGCSNSSAQTVTVTVCAPAFTTLNLTAFLEGLYSGINTMRANIYDLGISTNSSETDSITVSLWAPISLANPNPDYTINAVVHTDGTSTMQFPAAVTGNEFYIAVKHRNHMETWSKLPVTFTSITEYDFSNALTQAYDDGVNQPMASVAGGKFAFYGGDVNLDGTVDGSDANDIEIGANNFDYGYNAADANGDGETGGQDANIVEINANLFLFYARPY